MNSDGQVQFCHEPGFGIVTIKLSDKKPQIIK